MAQLLIAKYLCSTLMHELKEYQDWIWLKIVCRTSRVILGANLPKIQDILYYGQHLKNAVRQWPEGQLLLAKYVSSTLMYELKEYQKEILLKIICRESCVLLGANLPKIQYILLLWTKHKKAVKQWPVAQLLLAKYVSSTLMYELK